MPKYIETILFINSIILGLLFSIIFLCFWETCVYDGYVPRNLFNMIIMIIGTFAPVPISINLCEKFVKNYKNKGKK